MCKIHYYWLIFSMPYHFIILDERPLSYKNGYETLRQTDKDRWYSNTLKHSRGE